jgi:hypothetical protein
MFSQPRSSEHRGRRPADRRPGPGRPARDDAAGLRRCRASDPAGIAPPRAWGNWRGIADLAPGGGYGELYGSVASVPGREFSASRRCPGARQPHRVLVQVPDDFDTGKRCVVVAPRPVRAGSMAPSPWPGRGACRAAARWPIPTRARAPTISTWTPDSVRRWHAGRSLGRCRDWRSSRMAGRPAAWPTSTRIRRTTPRPTGAAT